MKTMTKAVVSLMAVCLVMSATTAGADEGFVELRTSLVHSGDDGYAAISGSGAAAGLGLGVGYELTAIQGLRVLASYDGDGSMQQRFDGDVDALWTRNRLMANMDYGVDIMDDFFRPLVRVGFGYSQQSLEMVTDDVRYRDIDHGLTGLAAGGLEFSIGRSESRSTPLDRFSIGANLLLGYVWQSEASFDNMSSTGAPEEPTDDDPWPRGSYDAGSMQMSGFTWSMGASMRYQFGQ